ncbi:MAG TPA: 3-hydroxybenzoate 6-monooxygenase [Micromonosporaceae bacterium]|nr:3-hydroxybenzoate 6-monooxygenase [Micromonosporaceae bacterium]
MSAHILIAGGGIGGLAAALALARHGHRVTVLERHPQFTELGAGIQLAPNAFAALDQLGVGDEVRRRAVFIDELRLMDGTTGKLVAAMPLARRYRERFGNPYVVVHRNDLYQPLLSACRHLPDVELRAGAAVTGYEQDGAGVTVRLESGERPRGDALIGADGIRSAVRRHVVGDGEPRVSGHTIYRSLIPMRLVPDDLRWNTVTLWAGPRCHFVHYPVSEGEFLNLAAVRDDGASEVVVGRPTERQHVLSQFEQMSDVARRLLELGAEWRSWVLCDRDPAPAWTQGRVTLLGDAAHPMLQYAAQGACMALEDAVMLGTVFAGTCGDLSRRLADYQAARLHRTARAQLISRGMTELYHSAGPDAVHRNEMLSGLSADQMYERVSWLHGGPGVSQDEPG